MNVQQQQGAWRSLTILAVDAGTNLTGLALIRDDKLLWSHQLVLKPTGPGLARLALRLEMLRTTVGAEIIRRHPHVLAVETPIQWETGHSREGKSTVGAGYGVVLTVGAVHGLKLIGANPTTVKKLLTGNPRAGKPAMVWAARTRFGLPGDLTEDESDACGVGVAAQDALAKEEMAVQQALFSSEFKKGRVPARR